MRERQLGTLQIVLAINAAMSFVIAQIGYKFYVPVMPIIEVMRDSACSVCLPTVCAFSYFWRHRPEEINMSSVWECSRNYIAAPF